LRVWMAGLVTARVSVENKRMLLKKRRDKGSERRVAFTEELPQREAKRE
ncbi:1335_t:CDS:1, partial [Rhizophagus irregularis]